MDVITTKQKRNRRRFIKSKLQFIVISNLLKMFVEMRRSSGSRFLTVENLSREGV